MNNRTNRSYTSTMKNGFMTNLNLIRKNREQTIVRNLIQTQSHRQDTFTINHFSSFTTSLYSPNMKIGNNYISNELLSFMNNDISSVKMSGGHYECNGVTFEANQIPSINESTLQEIKARNNFIDFGKNQYFKYISSDGQSHNLYTDNKGIGSIFSEFLRGVPYDAPLEKYSNFWNYLNRAKDTVFITERFSLDEIQGYLKEAEIKPGFFTVKMGDKETTRFYSIGKYSTLIYSQERYDDKYKHLTESGYLLREYEPGSIIKIKGQEYVLKENHTLEIPYGADIYDIEYPNRVE